MSGKRAAGETPPVPSAGAAVAKADTPYGRILVWDSVLYGQPVRFYQQDGAYASATFLEEGRRYELVFEYTKAYNRMFLCREIHDTLMIGGAACQYPKYYISHFPDCRMDVVEINEKAIEIAKRYFFLDDLIREFRTEEEDRLRLITADGRTFLRGTSRQYDAILNDAFAGEMPVETLATVEAAKLFHHHLRPGGVYLANVLGAARGERSLFLRSEAATLGRFFANVRILPVRRECAGWEYTNYILAASDGPLPFPDAITPEEGGLLLTDCSLVRKIAGRCH